QDHERRIVSVGQAVKAMVLNGLGFVNQRRYLVPHFFQDKPTERLIGAGIGPEHLNDDVTGRALEKLYEHDVTLVYARLASQAVRRLGLKPRFGHLDTTVFTSMANTTVVRRYGHVLKYDILSQDLTPTPSE
nr:DUF4277 domain-containing protein [Gammaproteobacteria bacterium]